MSDKLNEVCGVTWDHTEVIDYDRPDGVQWSCSECGAEMWESREKDAAQERIAS